MVVQRYVSYIAHLVCLAVNVFLNIFFFMFGRSLHVTNANLVLCRYFSFVVMKVHKKVLILAWLYIHIS